MSNPVDFVGVAKFTELAGGMEVNNLQAAIRKAVKELTLPDVSDAPAASTGRRPICRSSPRPPRGASLWKRSPR